MRGLFPSVIATTLVLNSHASQSAEAPDAEDLNVNKAIINSQDWNTKQAMDWYSSSEGSRLIPEYWFKNMIDPVTNKPFGSAENMARFGYPYFKDYNSKTTNPIGFTTEYDENNVAWVGLNCAACHTSVIEKDDQLFLFHGGQSMGDFRKMLTSLVDTVKSYADNPVAMSILPNNELIEPWLEERAHMDKALEGTANWGPGRIDAITYIGAKVGYTVHDFDESSDFQPPKAHAPVNPPPAWNAGQLQKVQYTGFVDIDYDADQLSILYKNSYFRNYIQALSVFSQAEFSKEEGLTSSVDAGNLVTLEQALSTLHSPQWPEELGIPDADLVTKGEMIYSENCASCHSILSATDTNTMVLETSHEDYKTGDPALVLQPAILSQADTGDLDPINTDIMSLCILNTTKLNTGKLQGIARNYSEYENVYEEPEPYEETASMLDVTAHLANDDYPKKRADMAAAVLEGRLDNIKNIMSNIYESADNTPPAIEWDIQYAPESMPQMIRSFTGVEPYEVLKMACEEELSEKSGVYGYKARPLNGIWATAPFLHNGSVPTLMDLLKPQSCDGVSADDCRPTSFNFNGLEYDTVNIGYKIERNPQGHADFNVYAPEGHIIPGNWNGGHEYGVDLSRKDKEALIEYLKTL